MELRKQVAAAGHELVEEYIDDGFGDYEAFLKSGRLYSITISAATCSVSGKVKPSALAVFILITSSIFVA